MYRFILESDGTRWRIRYAAGFALSVFELVGLARERARVEHAADVFLIDTATAPAVRPLPWRKAPKPVESRLVGSFWCSLSEDGNFDIGSRLTLDEANLHGVLA